MYATDFEFNGRRASELGLMICTWNDESDVAEGGNIEPNAIKPPNRDTFDWYGGQFNTPLAWDISICKINCTNINTFSESEYFSVDEEREVARWLMRPAYKWTRFLDEREGSEDIWYKCNVEVTPHQYYGKTIGFDLKFTSNCAYGFSNVKTFTGTISESSPVTLRVSTDINEYIYPVIKLDGSGKIKLYNENDLEQTLTNNRYTEVTLNGVTTIDSDNDIVTGISNPSTDFNYWFLHLVDGTNVIKTDSGSDIDIEIKYREARRVVL